ncbi:uncharacterized protein B0I36DRAFT_331188 [Microdochium trichocladiopsis]|uniref:C2H2-type domain-containing protein n=1 Tax=Microdochium trichocladiopsis TaxID=1682393 RepID=A0A9P8Y0Z9_9PEZI|nr:uncharacterized protein B0I36DRAFT_331188 [Microdochium trichocladiopsis]KAH7026718.1 hypothetical protein B0I36DRAFT_331188 [Microdochium trichocladiopsis]
MCPSNPREFKCSPCGVVFLTRTLLRSHERKCPGPPPAATPADSAGAAASSRMIAIWTALRLGCGSTRRIGRMTRFWCSGTTARQSVGRPCVCNELA